MMPDQTGWATVTALDEVTWGDDVFTVDTSGYPVGVVVPVTTNGGTLVIIGQPGGLADGYAIWAFLDTATGDPGPGNIGVSGSGNQPRDFAVSKVDADGVTRNLGAVHLGDALVVTDDPDTPPTTGFARYIITTPVTDLGTYVTFTANRTDTSGATQPPPVGTRLRVYWYPQEGGAGSPGDYVPIDGGTMTGPLILSGDPVVDLGAVTKQYVDDRSSLPGADVIIDGTWSDAGGSAWSYFWGSGATMVRDTVAGVVTPPSLRCDLGSGLTNYRVAQQTAYYEIPPAAWGIQGEYVARAATGPVTITVEVLHRSDGGIPQYLDGGLTKVDKVAVQEVPVGAAIPVPWSWAVPGDATTMRVNYRVSAPLNPDDYVPNSQAWIDNASAFWISSSDPEARQTYGCALYRKSLLNLTGSALDVSFGSMEWDVGGYWAPSPTPGRAVVPAGLQGYHVLRFAATFTGGDPDTYRWLLLRVNGVTIVNFRIVAPTTTSQAVEVARTVYLNGGDAVSCQVNNGGSSAPQFTGCDSFPGANRFEVIRL